jgi:uncharacterized protein
MRPGGHYRIRRTDVERLGATRSGAAARPYSLDAASRQRLAEWAERHRVRRLALFGSAARRELRPDSDVDLLVELRPDSDVDLLVELRPDARVGLFEHVRMADELEEIFSRPVDLGTWAALKPRLRARVEDEAVLLYEA